MARRDDITRDMFELPALPSVHPGGLNCQAEVCGVLSVVLKHCPESRYQVAARMSELLGVEITKYMLDSWTAESREGHRFPLEYVAAFEVATDTYELSELLARVRGFRLLVGKETLLAELGRIGQARQALSDREKELKQMLKGGE